MEEFFACTTVCAKCFLEGLHKLRGGKTDRAEEFLLSLNNGECTEVGAQKLLREMRDDRII